MSTKREKRYVVANPRGIPAGLPVFRQAQRDGVIRGWLEGDAYDGDAPAEPLRRGFLVEVKDG